MGLLETIVRPVGRALRGRRADESLSITHSSGLTTVARLDVRSTSFSNGEEVPDRCCGKGIGTETSPQLSWSQLPEDTVGLLLIVEDIDTPTRAPGIHTAVSFSADRDELAEGELTPRGKDFSYLHHRPGVARYYGPRPIPGHGPHRYRYHLYATDVVLDLAGLHTVDQLSDLASGHVLAVGMLEGTRESH